MMEPMPWEFAYWGGRQLLADGEFAPADPAAAGEGSNGGMFAGVLVCALVAWLVWKVVKARRAALSGRDVEGDVVEMPAVMTKLLENGLFKFIFCFLGIQACYLTWGALQERLLTIDYDGERFKSSVALVFCNRVAAILLSTALGGCGPLFNRKAPLTAYFSVSMSNIVSTTCQYEALKHISFATQVLAKSMKMLPVMVSGVVLYGKSYPFAEYIVAGLVTAGVTIFKLAEAEAPDTPVNNLVGLPMLALYLAADSFTSTTQQKVFESYKASTNELQFFMNGWSMVLSCAGAILQGGMSGDGGFTFLLRHPDALVHVSMLSLAGAVGQLFIFFTIQQFGALVFATIMTVRQLIAIVLSSFLYGHSFTFQQILGIGLVFGTLAWNIRRKHQSKKAKPSSAPPPAQDPKPDKDSVAVNLSHSSAPSKI